MTYTYLQRSGIIEATTWEGTTMYITFSLNVQAHEGTLMLTDRAGKTVTFSKEQTVQKKVSMITLGELCGLPKRQLAASFGFKTRKSYMTSATLSSKEHRKTSCLNGQGHTPHRNAPRRSRCLSSARVSRPLAICMRLLRR